MTNAPIISDLFLLIDEVPRAREDRLEPGARRAFLPTIARRRGGARPEPREEE